MLTKSLSAALLGATLLAAPALAQQTPPAGGASTGNWITQETPGQWRTSKLDGLDVYNNDEKIGDIKELLVDNSGEIQAVVIGVGGFLGMGEHDVAVPFEQVKFVEEPRRTATRAPNTANPPTANTTGTVATNPPAAPANTTTRSTTSDAYRGYPDHAEVAMTKDQLKAL